MLHGKRSGYLEAEAYGSAKSKLFKILGSGYVLEAYAYIYTYIRTYKKSRTKNYMI